MRSISILIAVILLASCEEDVTVKPRAMLSLEYAKAVYDSVDTDCPFTFLKNKNAYLISKPNCAINLNYPQMKATIYLTYQKVKGNNLDSLLYDAQKLTYDHNIKASGIPEQLFVNKDNSTYGMFYQINGNAATQAQFYVTDSVKNFITGSVYFEAKPNFDSIYPAVVYLRNDMRAIMETLEWKD